MASGRRTALVILFGRQVLSHFNGINRWHTSTRNCCCRAHTHIHIYVFVCMYGMQPAVNAISVTFIWLFNCLLPFGIHFCRLCFGHKLSILVSTYIYFFVLQRFIALFVCIFTLLLVASVFRLPRVFLFLFPTNYLISYVRIFALAYHCAIHLRTYSDSK